MSGSLVLRSGVGTQMLIVSSSSTAEKSAVARSFPDSTSGPSAALGTSPTYESPAFTRLAFSWLTSMPVTANPALANSTASGRPTYPIPTIPTRAARVRIFSSRISAVVGVSSCASGIKLVFSHICAARPRIGPRQAIRQRIGSTENDIGMTRAPGVSLQPLNARHAVASGSPESTKEISMFLTLFAILLVMWLLGFLAFHVAGGLIHLLLIIAVISLVVHFLRKVVARLASKQKLH